MRGRGTFMRRAGLAVISSVLVAISFAATSSANHSVTNWQSTGPNGGLANIDSNLAGLSDDGTRVFFDTTEAIVSADTDGRNDVYERFNGVTTLISTGPTTTNAPVDAVMLDASKDGTRVFFETTESLTANDGDGNRDLYERFNGTTTLVSTGPQGSGGADSFFAGISQDGLHAFFVSYAPVVSTDQDPGQLDVFDRFNGTTTTQISIGGNGPFGARFDWATPDGSTVYFHTDEKLAGTGDTDSVQDVYENTGGTVTRISTGPTGGNASELAYFDGASVTGSHVFFETVEAMTSDDTDFDVSIGDGYRDVYDRSGGTTTLVSTSSTGGSGFHAANFGGNSLDGSRVFFDTREALAASDTDGSSPSTSCKDLLGEPTLPCVDVYERSGGNTTLISTGTQDENGADEASFSAISQEGGRVLFLTSASLTSSDMDNSAVDVYQRLNGVTSLISTGTVGGTSSSDYGAQLDGVSADGLRVFFSTYEQLLPSDTDGNWNDIYERVGSATTLISTGPNAPVPNTDTIALWRGASVDGSRAFFQTSEQLVAADTDPAEDVYSREAPISGYVRPKGAAISLFSLVPASDACTAGGINRKHGATLTYDSCSPGSSSSSVLTVGTPDANGAIANSQSKARYQLVSGDMQLHAAVTDVRCRAANLACPGGAASDYTGKLLARAIVRATDRYNGTPPTESATTVDFPLELPVSCTSTVDTAIGSSCNITSSLNSLIPGATVAGNRTIYELGQVEVLDAGPNGLGYDVGCPTTCGDGDETVFMRQGVFIP